MNIRGDLGGILELRTSFVQCKEPET